MGFNSEQEARELRRQVAELQRGQAQRRVWSYPTIGPMFLQIIGGNSLGSSGQAGIGYQASLTLAAYYNPDVDVVYPTGLGNAWLWVDGQRQTVRVLVAHDASNYQTPLLAGVRRRVLNTTVLTVASGADIGRTMVAYRHTWE